MRPNLHYCPKTRDQVTQQGWCSLFFNVLVTRLNRCDWNCSYILLPRLEFSLNFKLCNDEGLVQLIKKKINKWSCHPNGKLKCVWVLLTTTYTNTDGYTVSYYILCSFLRQLYPTWWWPKIVFAVTCSWHVMYNWQYSCVTTVMPMRNCFLIFQLTQRGWHSLKFPFWPGCIVVWFRLSQSSNVYSYSSFYFSVVLKYI